RLVRLARAPRSGVRGSRGSEPRIQLCPADAERPPVKLEHAQASVASVIREASGPVSVFVADTHGELVAAATMDGAAPDTRLNAQRKAYTAGRREARSTRGLAA